MKIILVLSLLCLGPQVFADQTNEEFVPLLKLSNGVIYTNARIKFANLSQVFVLTDDGGARVQSELLPEPQRSKYYDGQKLNEIVAARSAAKLRADQLLAEQNDIKEREDRKEFVQTRHPLRVIEGKLDDFTWALKYGPQSYEIWMIKGKVLQVLNDGLLVRRDDVDLTIFLKNSSKQETAIDGSPIKTLAVPVGRYQYLNTQGAQQTVMSYSGGRYYDPETDHFTEKFMADTGGEKKSYPVTEQDNFPLLEKDKPPAPKKTGVRKLSL